MYKCGTVMLVDDNETDTLITKRMLELSGMANQIISKNSGQAGLDYLTQHKDNPDLLPDVIFLDINMPLISGFDFLVQYHTISLTLGKQCKIIILTSSDSLQDITQMELNQHVSQFITKPLSVNMLRSLPMLAA
jgi:CheY-like chemotaxis protein